MRHTKIMATVGPATSTEEAVMALIDAGVDIFRLNFSHGTHDSHAAAFQRIRAAARRAGRPEVAILQDLSGPKIRTGALAGGGPLTLTEGQQLRIATGDFVGGPGRVSTTYDGLARSVGPGDRLLLDDGRIELKVTSTDGHEVVTTVVEGGPLGEHKGINAPGVPLPASALTPKDAEDLRFGLQLGVDMVALSFVQTAEDLRQTRRVMVEGGRPDVPLVAKLERPQAIEHLEEIFGACDAVMVARGDLGLELPLERVPRVQKEVTRWARAVGIPVIVATQVLDSMRTESRPTRAEVSDAATAVDEGVDAIMLAGETAAGRFPVRAVQTLDSIIREAEATSTPDSLRRLAGTSEGHARALCEAAVTLANSGDADAIVAVTRGGATARMLSSLRPRARIFAATEHEETARRLMLYWGVVPVVTTIGDDVDSAGVMVGRGLEQRGVVRPGAVVVFVSVSPDFSRADANFLKIQRLADHAS
ncbi:MAG TPA: pyruvate kinase [Vicinamibacterales bacterium]|nr:pyruvate kinase [Vicinamibacterales bacterium]